MAKTLGSNLVRILPIVLRFVLIAPQLERTQVAPSGRKSRFLPAGVLPVVALVVMMAVTSLSSIPQFQVSGETVPAMVVQDATKHVVTTELAM